MHSVSKSVIVQDAKLKSKDDTTLLVSVDELVSISRFDKITLVAKQATLKITVITCMEKNS